MCCTDLPSYFVVPAIIYDEQSKVFCNYFTFMYCTVFLDMHACMYVKTFDMHACECHYRDCGVYFVTVYVCVYLWSSYLRL